MNPSTIHKACIDLGNGNMKGALIANDQLISVTQPAQFGVGDTHMGILTLGGVGKRRRDLAPVSITFDGGEYLVGHNVARYTTPLERLDSGKYVDSPEVRALTYATLAQLVGSQAADVALIVALPVEVLMAPTARDTVKGIQNWLLGEHHFAYDGHQAHITIHAVKAMAQPVGAWAYWGLDNAGQWAREESDLTDASIAVLDSGFNTLDLLAIRQGQIEKRFTGGETLGVRRAAEEIARSVKAQSGYAMSRIEADGYIRAYLDKRSMDFGQGKDLKPIVKQALASLATQTLDFVEETWGMASQFNHVILVGGGAVVLNAAIRRRIPHAVMLPDPVTTNAAGLAKLAQRPGIFKGL
jgi:hypothetical protein